MKISTMMISIVLVAFFVTTFVNLFVAVSEDYSVTYDSETNSTLQTLNQFDSIRNTTEQINQTLFTTDTTSVTDILGGFLGAGFNVLKLSGQSVAAMGNIVTTAGEQLGLGAGTAILMTVVVLLVLFAIIGVLVGRSI